MEEYQINFSRLVNAEFYQFLSLIAKLANDADPLTNKFKPEYDKLDAILKRLLEAINRERGSKLTKEIKALNLRRNFAFSGFLLWLLGLSKYPKLPQREAATTLLNKLSLHGKGITKQNNQQKSAVLTQIVEKCTNDNSLILALATLNGNDWITEIEQANLEYIKAYSNRSGEMGEAQIKESFMKIRLEAQQAYLALVNIITSRYKIAIADNTDTKLLQKCLYGITANVTQFKQLIKASKEHKTNVYLPNTPTTNQ